MAGNKSIASGQRLTALAIQKLKPRAEDYLEKVPQAPNLYVDVSRTGRKMFQLRPKKFDPAKGRRATQVRTLGSTDEVSLRKPAARRSPARAGAPSSRRGSRSRKRSKHTGAPTRNRQPGRGGTRRGATTRSTATSSRASSARALSPTCAATRSPSSAAATSRTAA